MPRSVALSLPLFFFWFFATLTIGSIILLGTVLHSPFATLTTAFILALSAFFVGYLGRALEVG